MRFNSAYEEFFDWAAQLRGASAPSQYHNLLELLVGFVDGRFEQYWEFVDDFIRQVDAFSLRLSPPDNRPLLSCMLQFPYQTRLRQLIMRNSTASKSSLDVTRTAPSNPHRSARPYRVRSEAMGEVNTCAQQSNGLVRLGARRRAARRAPGRASQGRARALTPGQRRAGAALI